MNEKFNKNAKVEKFTNMLGIAVRLIVIDPFINTLFNLMGISLTKISRHSLYYSKIKPDVQTNFKTAFDLCLFLSPKIKSNNYVLYCKL